MFAIKVAGMILIFFSCTAYGMYRAHLLQSRVLALQRIYNALEALKEHIEYGSGEISKLLEICFKDCPEIVLSENEAKAVPGEITAQDAEVLNEFFSRLGSGDVKGECSRIKLYESILFSLTEEAKNAESKGAKIWRTVGICVGAAGCIMIV